MSSLRVLKDELEHELTDLEEEGATKDVDVGGTERRTIDQDRAELLELQQVTLWVCLSLCVSRAADTLLMV